MIEINHCRRGRFGCKVNGRQVYLGEGEMEANLVGVIRENPEFPLGFYAGVEILIDPEPAKAYLRMCSRRRSSRLISRMADPQGKRCHVHPLSAGDQSYSE